MYKRVIFGAVANGGVAKLVDLGRRESVMFASLAALVLLLGLYPKPFTDAIEVSAANLVTEAGRTKQAVGDGVPADAVRAGTDVDHAQHSPT